MINKMQNYTLLNQTQHHEGIRGMEMWLQSLPTLPLNGGEWQMLTPAIWSPP